MRPLPGDFPEQDYPSEAFQEQERRILKKVESASRGRCMKCGRENPEISTENHHVVPQDNGGPDLGCNLAPLCEWCHDGRYSEWSIEAVNNRYDHAFNDPWHYFISFGNWIATTCRPQTDILLCQHFATVKRQQRGGPEEVENVPEMLLREDGYIDPYEFFANEQPFSDRNEAEHFPWWPESDPDLDIATRGEHPDDRPSHRPPYGLTSDGERWVPGENYDKAIEVIQVYRGTAGPQADDTPSAYSVGKEVGIDHDNPTSTVCNIWENRGEYFADGY